MKKTFFSKLNPEGKGKFISFFEKKGFYIVLFMCVLIIGTTAVLVTRNNLNYYSQGDVIDQGLSVDESIPDGIAEIPDIPTIANLDPDENKTDKKVDVSDKEKQKEDSKKDTSKDKVIVIEQPPAKKENSSSKQQDIIQKPKEINRLLPPVQGEIILEYAKDNLIYSKTLEEWRTHNGIDIKGDRGTQVKAAADGIVEKIYKDDGLGITILVDHGNGLKTKYSNLSTDSMVKEKQSVKQGQVISGVGDTAMFEIGDQPHLHFEVIKDGKNIDPKQLLPN